MATDLTQEITDAILYGCVCGEKWKTELEKLRGVAGDTVSCVRCKRRWTCPSLTRGWVEERDEPSR